MLRRDCRASCQAYEVILNRLTDFNKKLNTVSRIPTGLPTHVCNQLDDILRILPEMRTYLEAKDYQLCEDFLSSVKAFSKRFPDGITHDHDVIIARYESLLQEYLALRTMLRENLRKYKRKQYG